MGIGLETARLLGACWCLCNW